MLPKSMQKYIQLSSNEAVIEAYKNFLQMNIDYITIVKNCHNGNRCWLTNLPKWAELFFENGFNRINQFENTIHKTDISWHLWSNLQGKIIYQNLKEHFDIAWGVTLVMQFHGNVYEFWLSNLNSGTDPVEMLLNQKNNIVTLCKKFIMEKAKLIHDAEANYCLVPPQYFDHTKININPKDRLSQRFNTKTHFKHLYLPSSDYTEYLTQKELECLKWLFYGKNAEDIATITNKSKRTVETQIYNIKKKLGCNKQFMLGYLLGIQFDHEFNY